MCPLYCTSHAFVNTDIFDLDDLSSISMFHIVTFLIFCSHFYLSTLETRCDTVIAIRMSIVQFRIPSSHTYLSTDLYSKQTIFQKLSKIKNTKFFE